MDPLREDELRRARETPPEVKLRQALALMAEGISLQEARLRRADPDASDAAIAGRLERWMLRAD